MHAIWRLRAAITAAAVQTIQAAPCMEVPGNPGRPAARAIPVKAPMMTEAKYNAAQNAMKLQVALPETRRELEGPASSAKVPQSVCGMRSPRSAITCSR